MSPSDVNLSEVTLDRDRANGPAVADLAAAYVELQDALVESADIAEFMSHVTRLAAWVAHSVTCGVTMRRGGEVSTVAVSDELASRIDEIQYGRGQGPCLQALHTGEQVLVSDLATDERWSDYRIHALAWGIRSSLSLPLAVDGATIGALNIYSLEADSFGRPERQHAEQFARQATTALKIVLRRIDQVAIEQQLREALATRAVIDQAIGIIMGQRRISGRDAYAILRETSQNSNRKLLAVAADLITNATGHPPHPPKPFSNPR